MLKTVNKIFIDIISFINARLAQLVEHRSYEPKVRGSTPLSSIKFIYIHIHKLPL